MITRKKIRWQKTDAYVMNDGKKIFSSIVEEIIQCAYKIMN